MRIRVGVGYFAVTDSRYLPRMKNQEIQPVLRSLLLSMTLVTAVLAQEPTQVDDQARELFRSLMSPYCPGSLLAECPSSQAAVLRDSVRARLRRGQTPEQIETYLVGVYGPQILASPPFAGMGTLPWVGAAALVVGGLAAAVWWMRRQPDDTAAPAPVAAAGDLQRLRQDMEKHD